MSHTDLAFDLSSLVLAARSAGLTQIDLAALEDLLHMHHARRDLLDRRRDMLVVGLDPEISP